MDEKEATRRQCISNAGLHSRRLYITFQREFTDTHLQSAFLDYGLQASRFGLKSVSFDLSEIPQFDPELRDIRRFVERLCPTLPAGLRYACFVKPRQLIKRLLWDAAFSSNWIQGQIYIRHTGGNGLA